MKQVWAKQKGFTIVELLVVIVVIAILAAITIVAYGGISGRANDTAVKSDLENFGKQMELIRIDTTSNTYPTSAVFASKSTMEFTKSAYSTGAGINNLAYCLSGDATEYVLVALSKSGAAYSYSSIRGLQPYTPTWSSTTSSTCNILSNTAGYTNNWGYTGSGNGWNWAN